MNTPIQPGMLLLSDPFLKDPNFIRSAILICQHDEATGSFGFVVNKRYQYHLGELIDDFSHTYFPLYLGGPVQIDTIHFIHKRPDVIGGSTLVGDGIYWGGNFEEVTVLLKEKQLNEFDIRFFVGYSGWDEHQLEEELNDKAWIATKATPSLVFAKQEQLIWKNALNNLGGEYALMSNYPTDPQLN